MLCSFRKAISVSIPPRLYQRAEEVLREHRMNNSVEARPYREKDLRAMAFRAARRDNPEGTPEELKMSADRRLAAGAKPHVKPATPKGRALTARDLERERRRALVKSGRHLR